MTTESLEPDPDGIESGTVPPERVRGPEILATTMDLVREQGLSNVRVSDVAERAGTSPTSVIYYFASKGQLFEQAVITADAEFYARLRPELAAIDSGIDQLACLVVRSSTSEWPLWVDTWLFARQHRELRVVEREFEQRWCALIADIVREGQRRGEFAPIDAESFAIRLSAVSEGLALHIVLGQPDRSPEHYVEMMLTMAAAELGCSLDRLRQAAADVPTEPAAPTDPADPAGLGQESE